MLHCTVITLMLLSIMSSLQEECERLKEAARYGEIDDIKMLASSGVDVNAVVDCGEVSDLTCCIE